MKRIVNTILKLYKNLQQQEVKLDNSNKIEALIKELKDINYPEWIDKKYKFTDTKWQKQDSKDDSCKSLKEITLNYLKKNNFNQLKEDIIVNTLKFLYSQHSTSIVNKFKTLTKLQNGTGKSLVEKKDEIIKQADQKLKSKQAELDALRAKKKDLNEGE